MSDALTLAVWVVVLLSGGAVVYFIRQVIRDWRNGDNNE